MSDQPTREQPNFEGWENRTCGEHRTVGPHRAWCYDCTEWCYSSSPEMGCNGCLIPAVEADREGWRVRAETAEAQLAEVERERTTWANDVYDTAARQLVSQREAYERQLQDVSGRLAELRAVLGDDQ